MPTVRPSPFGRPRPPRAEYRAFQRAVHGYNLSDNPDLTRIFPTDNSPQTAMTWFEAAAYCDWLSQKDNIPPEQWCYDQNGVPYGPGMKAKEKFWELSGYRLPTEAEWEYVCRAGTTTTRYYGMTDALLPQYVWYFANSNGRTSPIGSLEPNDRGLFDILGNAFEWCFDTYDAYPKQPGELYLDKPAVSPIQNASRRIVRGGAFGSMPRLIRSAYRYSGLAGDRQDYVGLRPVRTLP